MLSREGRTIRGLLQMAPGHLLNNFCEWGWLWAPYVGYRTLTHSFPSTSHLYAVVRFTTFNLQICHMAFQFTFNIYLFLMDEIQICLPGSSDLSRCNLQKPLSLNRQEILILAATILDLIVLFSSLFSLLALQKKISF